MKGFSCNIEVTLVKEEEEKLDLKQSTYYKKLGCNHKWIRLLEKKYNCGRKTMVCEPDMALLIITFDYNRDLPLFTHHLNFAEKIIKSE